MEQSSASVLIQVLRNLVRTQLHWPASGNMYRVQKTPLMKLLL